MQRIPEDPPLSADLILAAYACGVFPMADADGVISWFSPDPRCIFELDRVHVPRTLRQTIGRGRFELRIDTAFAAVIDGCADRDEETWISSEIREVYCELHRRGCAHSVEAWQDGVLAGGLYGVALGGVFFGESMFHRVRDASKVALVALLERLRLRGFHFCDTQWQTPHLARFGTVEIPRRVYLRRLSDALQADCRFAEGPAPECRNDQPGD
ncbi:MAG: Leucyl/phenylalanyl-tRNA--protein transferase [Phycisphaerae bacterium]|nr:Leucyl/phenylalanyl-tRNA--protein transferase [Phycisphaerae bacterium]